VPTLCVGSRGHVPYEDAERSISAFPRGAWERVGYRLIAGVGTARFGSCGNGMGACRSAVRP
jgi:hypothetical protein